MEQTAIIKLRDIADILATKYRHDTADFVAARDAFMTLLTPKQWDTVCEIFRQRYS